MNMTIGDYCGTHRKTKSNSKGRKTCCWLISSSSTMPPPPSPPPTIPPPPSHHQHHHHHHHHYHHLHLIIISITTITATTSITTSTTSPPSPLPPPPLYHHYHQYYHHNPSQWRLLSWKWMRSGWIKTKLPTCKQIVILAEGNGSYNIKSGNTSKAKVSQKWRSIWHVWFVLLGRMKEECVLQWWRGIQPKWRISSSHFFREQNLPLVKWKATAWSLMPPSLAPPSYLPLRSMNLQLVQCG